MTQEEKTLILGALFHDIGKFEQRCTGNPDRKFHEKLGTDLIESGRFIDLFGKIIGKENINVLLNIISEHHNKNAQGLTKIVQLGDYISASERVEKEETEAYQDQWKHKHLASLFGKIKILGDKNLTPRYYKHKLLTKNEYDVIIPSGIPEEEIKEYAYNQGTWENFLEDLFFVLSSYENDNDFNSLINLLLIIFEKYMWCIPDFTGSSETDISLYNHLKDVAGFAHAIYLSNKENIGNNELNLIIGDIPGIQSYIFDVVNRKPAKILRGRSIFVQILTRNLASKLLKALNLTETNLIMLAGGKFYIISPKSSEIEKRFYETLNEIDRYLFENYRMELSFNCIIHPFNYVDLMLKKKSFGQIVEEASHELLKKRYKLFSTHLFDHGSVAYENYIWKEIYIENDGTGSDSIKCRVTDKPIRIDRKREIKIPSDEGLEFLTVDKQVEIEYKIGEKIVGNNLIILMEEDDLTIDPDNIYSIKDFKNDPQNKYKSKLLLNPTFEGLLKDKNYDKFIYKNIHYLEVANYCSRGDKENVMPFEEMAEMNNGAKFLALIKGDIDNLGLIMAYGLYDDKNDLTGVSRTTTLSNHLKYFFSFFLNGFLYDWEQGNLLDVDEATKVNNSMDDSATLIKDKKVYTIFAGGDDLMLVTPQSSALELVNKINKKFTEFICYNNEVHMSYSITHFKDHTPIRIVAEFAEQNQKLGKRNTKESQFNLLKKKDNTAFYDLNDKAGTYIFNTFIKNSDLDFLIEQVNFLTGKSMDDKSGLSKGLIRRLLYLSEMVNKYKETNDASYLIAYARLNYTVNRLLKNREEDIKSFFENVLVINKENNDYAQRLEKIIYPLICQVIYNTRK